MHERLDKHRRDETSRLGLPRTIATGFALLFVAFGIWGFWLNYVEASGVDFISFWAAGRLVLSGHASVAYDIALHQRVEQTIVPHVGLLPFPYPPPFLILVAPFALVPFQDALVVWVVATGAFYAFTARRFAPISYAFANPPALVDLLIGQTGFLTTGIFLLGLTLLPNAPFAAGAILGLLLIKPQLALLLPIAMLAGREWHAILGAVLSASLALAAALLMLGPATLRGFVDILPHYVGYMQHNSWNWTELASVFAFLRFIGVSPVAALAIQEVTAAVVATVTAIAWYHRWEEKVPILMAASMLVSPYLFTYDALFLIVPAAYFIERGRWGIVGILWLLCALPVVHFYHLYNGPNTIPLASLLAIALLIARHAGPRGAGTPD